MEINHSLFIVIGIVILLVLALLSIVIPRMISRHWTRHRAETVEKWEAEGIEFIRGPNGVQFGGLESMGANRITRGLGFAAITTSDLRLTRASPQGIWIIPFKQIKKVTIQTAFVGQRSKKTPFIVVRFTKDGQSDKLAFQTKEHNAWAKDLADAAQVRLQDMQQDS